AARARAAEAFPGPDEPVARALRRAAELDETHIALACRVKSQDIDLVAVYLPGLDIAQYALLAGPGGAGLPPAVAAARVEALERYYGFLDAAIAPLIDTPGTRDLVILLTDPGRSPSPARGLLVLAGATARSAARLEATPADVAPTILYLLGVPMSLELPGRPLSGLIADQFQQRVPMRTVPTYGQRPVTPRPRGGTPLDQEMIDRLRSLGYVR
ncbi:MAG: hypothetical protein IMZ67_07365, partial [Acidobacteria bacterium]|nr:hypothetical protein [Acidobacteriota bacterium]